HRLPLAAAVKERYNQQAPLVNENDTAALGAVGSVGFLALLWWLVSAGSKQSQTLATLNLAAGLLGTVGGVGSLLAFTVFPMIRGYNRISVLIAWFSLLAVALLLTRLREGTASWTVCAALFAFGIWDQTTPRMVPPYAAIRAERSSDD